MQLLSIWPAPNAPDAVLPACCNYAEVRITVLLLNYFKTILAQPMAAYERLTAFGFSGCSCRN
jgi:hypothetical protein